MTVASTSRSAGPFTGNGVTTSFPFVFKVFTKADIEVMRTVTATGVLSVLVLDSDYSVTLNVDQDASPGGSILYPILGAALPSTETLAVIGSVEYTQEASIANASSFLPRVIEDALDRIVILAQQLAEMLGRALRFPIGDTASAILPSAALRARKALVFDVDGNAGVSVDDYIDQLANVTAQANIAVAAAAAANSSEGNALTSANSAAASAAAAAASIGSVDGSVYYTTTDTGPTWTIPVPFITFTGAFIGGLKYRPTAFTSDPVAGTVTLTAVPITDFEAGTLVDLHFVPATV